MFFLFLLLIKILIKFCLTKYYPIEKYSSYEIPQINQNKYNFSLNIKDFKLGETIYLSFKCKIKIDEKDVIYFWSPDNFKNITNVSSISTINSCSSASSHYSSGSKEIYIRYCSVKKELDYNSLIISIDTYFKGSFTITNTKNNTITSILIIVFSSLFVLFIVITLIVFFCIKKKFNIKVYNKEGFISLINLKSNPENNNNQFNNFTPFVDTKPGSYSKLKEENNTNNMDAPAPPIN